MEWQDCCSKRMGGLFDGAKAVRDFAEAKFVERNDKGTPGALGLGGQNNIRVRNGGKWWNCKKRVGSRSEIYF